MITIVHLLRAHPRRWVVVTGGVTALVVVLLAVLLLRAGGPGRLSTADGTVATTEAASPTTTPRAVRSPGPTTTERSSPTTPQRSSATTTTTTMTNTSVGLGSDYELDVDGDDPALAGRPIPAEPDPDEPPTVTVVPPPWAASTRVTGGGQVATDVGCADDSDATSLDRFFSGRVGPVLGWDYQHVYALGGDRYLWLFQDVFIDHSGTKQTLGTARFVHNAAMLQVGSCFTLLHRGTADKPLPFEVGDGTVDVRSKWLWPMGGELVDGRLWVFWTEMVKDPYDPDPPNGLGWHPDRTVLATYDAGSLDRLGYQAPRNDGVAPIYGYAVASDETHTYFFGNTFEQNMLREGGFWNGPHSATRMYLARVPRGLITEWPEYRTVDGWSYAPEDAVPISERFYAENPMQPRFLDGQWVATTAVDGYWGDHLAVDVADVPWGPWVTVQYSALQPRNADPKMNTYHAQPLPWRDRFGSVQITVSNNARNMLRDAWPNPQRYRPMVVFVPFTPTPTSTTTTTSTSSTTSSTSSTTSSTTTLPPVTTMRTTTTTIAPTTTTSTTIPPTTTTSTTTTSTTTTSTVPSTTTSTTTTNTTTNTKAAAQPSSSTSTTPAGVGAGVGVPGSG